MYMYNYSYTQRVYLWACVRAGVYSRASVRVRAIVVCACTWMQTCACVSTRCIIRLLLLPPDTAQPQHAEGTGGRTGQIRNIYIYCFVFVLGALQCIRRVTSARKQ